MAGFSAKCLPAVGTITEFPSITGITGVGNISNAVIGPDERIWWSVENLASPLVGASTIAGVSTTYTVTGAGNADNFGGICTDGTSVYLADSTAKELFQFSTAGSVTANSGTLLGTNGVGGLAGVQFLGGKLYFADNVGSGKIGVINTDLATGLTLRTPTSSGGAHGLNIGPDGFGHQVLWFAEQTQNKIAYMTTAGVFVEFAIGFSPYYAVPGVDGNIYFTCRTAGKYGQVLLPSGTVTTWTSASGAAAQPGGIGADNHGFMWYCEEASNNLVRFPTSNPASTTVFASLSAASLPDKIILSPLDGKMAFTMHDAGKIGLIQA